MIGVWVVNNNEVMQCHIKQFSSGIALNHSSNLCLSFSRCGSVAKETMSGLENSLPLYFVSRLLMKVLSNICMSFNPFEHLFSCNRYLFNPYACRRMNSISHSR